MKKHDFESLMSQYRESLGTCSRQPQRKTRRVWLRPVASLGAAAIVIALASVLLWPRDAAATAWEKMTHALKDVKHFQSTGYQFWKGKWKRTGTVNYNSGTWEISYGTIGSQSFRCLANDEGLLVHYSRLPYILKTPKYCVLDENLVGNRSALDFVIKQVDLGFYRELREQTLIDKGKTSILRLTRKKGNYRADIVIDNASSRPQNALVTGSWDDKGKGQGYTLRYEFSYNDQPLVQLPAKPIVDTEKERASLTDTWTKALESSKDGIVDARVTSTGTIWLVVAFEKRGAKVRLPEHLRVEGADYGAITTYGNSGSLYDEDLKIGGKSIAVLGFVPMSRKQPLPRACRVVFGDYVTKFLSVDPFEGPQMPEEFDQAFRQASTVPLKHQNEAVPSYFPALSMCEEQIRLPLLEAYARANLLRCKGDFDGAIAAYKDIGQRLSEYEISIPGQWKFEIETTQWMKRSHDEAVRSRR